MRNKVVVFCMLCATAVPAQTTSRLLSPQTPRQPQAENIVTTSDKSLNAAKPSRIAEAIADISRGKSKAPAVKKQADAIRSIKAQNGEKTVFTDIGTLAAGTKWNKTLNFDKTADGIQAFQATDYFGNPTTHYGYAFKFKLDAPQIFYGTSDAYQNSCRIFTDPELTDPVQDLAYSFLTGLEAGTYYMIIDEGGYLNYDFSTPFTAATCIDIPEHTEMTLPYTDNDASIDQTNLKVAGDYYTKFYSFTVTDEKVVHFGVGSNTQLGSMDYVEVDLFGPNLRELLSADNLDVPLKPGVYFAAVYGVIFESSDFWAENAKLNVRLDIRNTDKAVRTIAFPCTKSFDFATDNPLFYGSWNTLWYKLSLTEDTMLGIDDPTGSYAFSILYPDMKQFAGYAPYDNPKITTVPAGDYYFILIDYAAGNAAGSFSLVSPYSYSMIDFSEQIKPGDTKTGDNSMFASTVMIADPTVNPSVQTAWTKGYGFDTEAGHIYKLTCNMFTNVDNDSYGLALFSAPNTGNSANDAIRGRSYGGFGKAGIGELTYLATDNSRINLMLFTQVNAPAPAERIYDISLKEIEYTATDEPASAPSIAEMTLPYVAYIHLSPLYNTFKGETEYYKLYKLQLNETAAVRISSGFNPQTGFSPLMHIYKDEAMTQELTSQWGLSEGGGEIALNAGTYYVKISDQDFHESSRDPSLYGECLIEITGAAGVEPIPVQTLAEMCHNAVTVSYAADLPYTDSGSFRAKDALWLQDEKLFITAPLNTKVYKVTGMKAGDKMHVMDKSLDNNYFVGIYTLTDGVCSLVADNYGDWEEPFNSQAAHKEFEAPADGDYYVRVSEMTTYPQILSVENPHYEVAMWTGTAADMPQTVTPALPDDYIITGTEASVSNITVGADLTATELLMALRRLDITAVTAAATTFAMNNTPLAWTVDEAGNKARFTVIDLPYKQSDDYTPAEVSIGTETGVNARTAGTIRISYDRQAATAYITGLGGNEVITVYNANGTMMTRQTNARISMNGWQSGVYIISVKDGANLSVFKIRTVL